MSKRANLSPTQARTIIMLRLIMAKVPLGLSTNAIVCRRPALISQPSAPPAYLCTSPFLILFSTKMNGYPPPPAYTSASQRTVTEDPQEQEVELYESYKEREAYDNLADLYAVILATEHLERAYARDAITREEYTAECNKLLSQFRLAEKAALGKTMTTETFMELYQMECPRARERLLRMGVPEQIKSGDDSGQHVAVTIAETVQMFITAMDAVKLEQRAVDELQPLLSDLMDALTRLPETPNDFESNRKVSKWLQKLNAMRAVDEIDEDDSRQLYHDLDSAYAEFTRYLKRKK